MVHIVRDTKVAQQYLDYWTELSNDTPAETLRPWNVKSTPTPVKKTADTLIPIFSPRTSLDALQWYTDGIDTALTTSGFSAAFGVNKLFAAVLAKNVKNVRYVLLEKPGPTYKLFSNVQNNFISIGAVLNQNVISDSKLQQWVSEKLTGLNSFVKYLHTKYLFIDPLGDDPIVISGSANFSDASTVNNDENMLVIKGNKMVADIYLGEFMRLWNHFYFRDIANKYAKINAQKMATTTAKTVPGDASPYLVSDDSWTNTYFGGNFRKTQERELFS